jgi:hypothetical protein
MRNLARKQIMHMTINSALNVVPKLKIKNDFMLFFGLFVGFHSLLFILENGGSTLLDKIRKCLPDFTASHAKR